MIKIFNANDKDFSTAGNIIIEPIKCIEYKKKSLNGWYIEVEIPIKYKEYISKDKLCIVKTKSKLNPQAFRIGEDIEYSTRKIKFKADHVMFDAKDYVLLDVRPTEKNGLNALNYINERTDNVSPFSIYSNVENVDTAYFIRKNLLEAWATIEERWGGVFDADNWNISFLTSIGNDNGETIVYGKNMQGFDIYEDWSSVCTKICPVGYDGIMLEETYLESDVQYEKPYTRVVDFQTSLEIEEQTEENLLVELRQNAEAYLEENKIPKVSYTVTSNINEKLEIGDSIKVSHPFVEIFTEVLEYEYDLISKKVKSLTFGNYTRDVKTKFDSIKNSIKEINQTLSKQEATINTQTNIINTLNKNGYVYIDDNEILILDAIPKEDAKNVWRFGLGGIGFSSNGYEGPFETAITMDGQINADFITTGTLNVSRIEGLSGTLSSIEIEMDSITQTVGEQNNKISEVTQTVDELNAKIQDIADITTYGESMYAKVELDSINESEPIQITVKPTVENISYLYPHSNLYPSEDLFLKLRTIRFTNKSLEETDENKYIDYVLPDDLLIAPDGTYDEFYLGYDEQICHITKRCQYNADGTVSKLDAEQITSYEYPKIELKDGDYTIELLGYANAYLSVRLMAQNIYTTQFATKVEMNSEIKQTVNEINIEVDEKLTGYPTTTEMNAAINVKANEIDMKVEGKVDEEEFTGANIILAINNDISSANINADKVSLYGKTINLTSDFIDINSNNFKVDEQGNMTCNNANITGGYLQLPSGISEAKIVVYGTTSSGLDYKTKIKPATIELDDGISENGSLVDMGVASDGSEQFGYIRLVNDDVSADTQVDAYGIYTPVLTQTSKESKKKNIEQYNEKALDVVRDSEIYTYNFKSENDETKKHYGFVIGDEGGKYKTPEEVISNNREGIDTYSMTAILWKAVQEQQKTIEQLQKEIQELKGEK